MTPRNKTKLSLAFNLAVPIGGAVALWWFLNSMQAQLLQPVDYVAQKNAIVKSEFERTLRTSIQTKMDDCLKNFKSSAADHTFACSSDIQIDMDKINAEADQRIAKAKEDEPRMAEVSNKVFWGLGAFYVLAATLVLGGGIRRQIKELRAPAATTSPS